MQIIFYKNRIFTKKKFFTQSYFLRVFFELHELALPILNPQDIYFLLLSMIFVQIDHNLSSIHKHVSTFFLLRPYMSCLDP